MTTSYTRHSPYTGNFGRERSHWERQWENEWQQSAIKGIEDYLVGQTSQPTFADPTGRLDNLTQWNQDRISEIESLEDWNQHRIKDIAHLQSQIDDWTDTDTDTDTWRTNEEIKGLISGELDKYNKFSDLQTGQQRLQEQIDTLGLDSNDINWDEIKNKPNISGYVSKDLLDRELEDYYDNYLDDELTNRGITGLTADQKSDLASISNVNLDNIRNEDQLKSLISSYGHDLGFGGTGGRSDTNILELVAKNLRDDDGNTIWERFADLDETNAADRISYEDAISSGLSNNLDYIKDTLNNTDSRNTQDIAKLQETLSGFDYDTQIDDLKKQLQTQGLSLKNLNAAYKNPGNTSQITNEALKSLVNLTVDDKLQDIPTTDTTGIENAITMAQGDITKLKTEFAKLGIQDLAGTTDLETLEAKLAEDFGESLTGLSSTYDTKISGLSEQLSNLLTNVDTKVDQTYLDDEFGDIKRSFESKLSDQGKLQAADFDADLASLKGDLQTQLTTQAGDQSAKLAGLKGDLQTQLATQAGQQSEAISNLGSSFADKLSTLGSTFTDKLATQAGTQAAGLAGLKGDLATQAGQQSANLAGLRGDLQTQLATQAGQQSLNLANLGADLRGDVAANQQMFNQRLSDYSQTQARNFQDLQTDWGRQLAAQEDALSDRITSQTGMLNDRLAKIASSTNYRTLSNNAPGIKIRRSKAYKSGRTSRGTGQLGRSMRISTLNI